MAAFWFGVVALIATGAAYAEQDILTPEIRYDVLKHKLNLAILAKKPKETIEIISQLRKTPIGVSGETLFYEAHAHYQLKNWAPAYRALVAYLNSMGRKGRNYKAGIGLFVEIEREIKKKHRVTTDLVRADRSWSAASAAFDSVTKQRNAWKEKVVTFGGPKDDMAWAMARRVNGGFLVGGTFEHKADKEKKMPAGRSMGIMALSRDGRMAWNRIIIGPAKDGSVRYLKAIPEGGFLLGGVHRGFQVAVRIDANAVPIRKHDGKPWISPYARSKDGTGGIVVRAGQGGFVALGAEVAVKDGKGPQLPFVVRLSKDGKTLGKTVYTGTAARFWHDITDAVELSGGDIVAVGETRPQAAWDTRPGMGYLLRIKPQGKVVWARRVPAQGKGDIRFSAVAAADGGGVIAAGHRGGELILFKAGADGQEQWRKIIAHRDPIPAAARELCNIPQLLSLVKRSQTEKNQPVPDADRVAAVREMTCRSGTPFVSVAAVSLRKDGYLVIAFQGRGNRKKTDIRLIALDKSGKVSWDKVYGHDGFDIATSALATEDGGAIIAGATDSIGAGGRDFLIFKVDKNGDFAPWTRLGPPGQPSAKPAKVKSVKLAPVATVPEKPEVKPIAKPEGTAAKDDVGRAFKTPVKESPKKEAKAEPEPGPGPTVKKDDDRKTVNPVVKKTEKKEAKVAPAAKPEPVAKKDGGDSATPRENDTPNEDRKVEPMPKPDPAVEIDGDEDTEASPKKEAKAKPESKPEPAAKNKADSTSTAPVAEEGEEPPATSFGEIFGSIFGSGDSEESGTKDEKNEPEKPDGTP